jgi:hypothetical protein
MECGPPDFVGMGTQKSGTSWWYQAIGGHPQVYIPSGRRKEMHYFDRFWRQTLTDDEIEAYHRFFPRPAGQITGEWTPRYLFDFWTPDLLRQAAPNAKVLVLLRDPIERYRSGLTHDLLYRVAPHPRAAMEAFSRGLYAQQLGRLLKAFPREQVLVQQYERCANDPVAELQRAYHFLGLDDSDFVPDVIHKTVNARVEKIPLSDDQRAHLIDMYSGDVAALAAEFPEIDLALWPHFAAARAV